MANHGIRIESLKQQKITDSSAQPASPPHPQPQECLDQRFFRFRGISISLYIVYIYHFFIVLIFTAFTFIQ